MSTHSLPCSHATRDDRGGSRCCPVADVDQGEGGGRCTLCWRRTIYLASDLALDGYSIACSFDLVSSQFAVASFCPIVRGPLSCMRVRMRCVVARPNTLFSHSRSLGLPHFPSSLEYCDFVDCDSDDPPRPPLIVAHRDRDLIAILNIHDDTPQRKELAPREHTFVKKIGLIVVSAHEKGRSTNADLVVLSAFPDKEVTTSNMLHTFSVAGWSPPLHSSIPS